MHQNLLKLEKCEESIITEECCMGRNPLPSSLPPPTSTKWQSCDHPIPHPLSLHLSQTKLWICDHLPQSKWPIMWPATTKCSHFSGKKTKLDNWYLIAIYCSFLYNFFEKTENLELPRSAHQGNSVQATKTDT